MSRARRPAALLLSASLLVGAITAVDAVVVEDDAAAASARRARRPPRPSRSATRLSALRAMAVRDPFGALAICESSGNPRAVSRSGRYRGSFQFDRRTWEAVGMTGDPIDHPHHVQLEAAHRLHAARGWAPWPSCTRRLRLR